MSREGNERGQAFRRTSESASKKRKAENSFWRKFSRIRIPLILRIILLNLVCVGLVVIAEVQFGAREIYHYWSEVVMVVMIVVNATYAILVGKDVSKVAQNLREIEEGNLSAKSELARNDELGDLSHGVNTTLASIKEILTAVYMASTELKASTGNLGESFSSVDKSFAEIYRIAENISAGSLRQSEAITEIADVIAGISRAEEEIASESKRIAQSATELKDGASAGIESLDRISITVEDLNKTSLEALDGMKRVLDSSSDIQKVTEILGGISKKIDLLALNASIEAERAGEMGRSFSVVADEIRKLAGSVSEQADSINGSVNNMGRDIRDLDVALGKNRQKTELSIGEVGSAVDTINKIFGSMDEIVVKSVNISDKMNDQAVNMERIANEIETINGAVEETTAATQEEAATCKEGALEIENMKGNVSTQESVAKKLSGIVEGIDF